MKLCPICEKHVAGRGVWCSRQCWNQTRLDARANPRPCDACGTLTRNTRFCSRACSARITNSESPRRRKTDVDVKCMACNADLRRSQLATKYFCSNTCRDVLRTRQKLEAWLDGTGRASGAQGGKIHTWARAYLYRERGEQCEECGWATPHPVSGRPPLQIDHIDADHSNDRPDNLKILCPNCHTLTVTWGFFGRTWAAHT